VVPDSYILEITVDTLDRALAAEWGGAHRIELCSDLSSGGLTPSAELMRLAREQLRLPVFAMIRPHAGDFVYSVAEFAEMRRDIGIALQMGMSGVVLGILTADGRVDIERTRQLVELARPVPVTFHRAFDVSADLHRSLEDVIQTGAARILTSGGAPTAVEGRTPLAELVRQARGRIIIVPGAGINGTNVGIVAKATGAWEFHAGLSYVAEGNDADEGRFEEEVWKLGRALKDFTASHA
jgi:copper homeostasis protein